MEVCNLQYPRCQTVNNIRKAVNKTYPNLYSRTKFALNNLQG